MYSDVTPTKSPPEGARDSVETAKEKSSPGITHVASGDALVSSKMTSIETPPDETRDSAEIVKLESSPEIIHGAPRESKSSVDGNAVTTGRTMTMSEIPAEGVSLVDEGKHQYLPPENATVLVKEHIDDGMLITVPTSDNKLRPVSDDGRNEELAVLDSEVTTNKDENPTKIKMIKSGNERTTYENQINIQMTEAGDELETAVVKPLEDISEVTNRKEKKAEVL